MHGIKTTNNSKHTLNILLTLLFLGLPVGITYADSNDVSPDISTYEFITDQSNVYQTGGFAGVNETYPIEGQFRLLVDFNDNTASFERVDANLLEPTGFLQTENLDELFNLTELTGTVVRNSAVVFMGKTTDDTDIDILIIGFLSDDSVFLYGKIIPPECCDFFYYTINALAAKKYSGGTGDPNNPYQITTAEDLMLLGETPEDYDKHFIQTADIDMDPNLPDGQIFTQAVIAFDSNDLVNGFQGTPFTGVFDGNDYVISNLTIKGQSYLGLFGQSESEAELRNIKIVDVNITGQDYLGALTGFSKGDIETSCSSGIVSGYSRIGGLTGRNWGSIKTSYCTSTVIGNDDVGGLAASNYGKIEMSYSNSTVIANQDVGGLAGENYGSINECYNTGSVTGNNYTGGLVGYNWQDSSITSSFWDIESSGQTTTSGEGTGLITAQMQTESTFTNAGWDFLGETANGPNDVWKMWEGYDYPHLAWEHGPNTPLVFVDINDPNFYGQMSRYEVTNDQYCDFLNAALASGDITINGSKVEGDNGSNSGEDYVGQSYYQLDGLGWTGAGATSGSAARIYYYEGEFSVDDGFGNHPVTYISWYGAMAFANYYCYYLPTEDQWQSVADYDGTYIYGCGETIDPGIANYRDSENPDGTTSVGSYGQYGYGMSDMAGNVWEWTRSELGSSRIFLGGSWSSRDSDCAISIRGDGVPYANYYDIGFRVCR